MYNRSNAKVAYDVKSTTKNSRKRRLMRHGEGSLGSHVTTLGNTADFLGVGSLGFALKLALGLENCGDVVDGTLVEGFEGCSEKYVSGWSLTSDRG